MGAVAVARKFGAVGPFVSKFLFAGLLIAGGLHFSGVLAPKPAATPPAPLALAAKPAPMSRPAVPLAKAAPAAPVDQNLVVRRILDIPEPIRYGQYYWDDKGVPAGPVVITVDIAARVLSIFRAGYEIGATAVIYGADDLPTPTGVFPITQKDAKHVSNLYNAPMPYMQRLTNDGVAIHGSKIDASYATHGCIGVPVEFAKLLFGQTKLGDRVIVTNGKMMDTGDKIVGA
jgi:lipoprotein-anchoring transpeptidase ErfK/SrfK